MDKFKQPHNFDDFWEDEWSSEEDRKRFKRNVKKWNSANTILQAKITRENKKYFDEKLHHKHK